MEVLLDTGSSLLQARTRVRGGPVESGGRGLSAMGPEGDASGATGMGAGRHATGAGTRGGPLGAYAEEALRGGASCPFQFVEPSPGGRGRGPPLRRPPQKGPLSTAPSGPSACRNGGGGDGTSILDFSTRAVVAEGYRPARYARVRGAAAQGAGLRAPSDTGRNGQAQQQDPAVLTGRTPSGDEASRPRGRGPGR